MASEYVDLVHQVSGVLPQLFGGTGNDLGFASGTYIVDLNKTGSTIALYSAVIFDTNGNLVLTTADNQVPVCGIVIGTLQIDGTIFTQDVPDQTLAVVQTGGYVQVLLDSHTGGLNGYGDYIYTTAATPGHVLGLTTRSAGAIGVLLTPTGLVSLWNGAAIGGPQAVTQEGVSVNPETDGMDFASVLPARGYGSKSAVDLAPELIGGLVAAQIAVSYGSVGTTVIRPTSDALKYAPITYSSGSTGWNLVNGTSVPVPPSDPHYTPTGLGTPRSGIIFGFSNPGLDYTYRIDSITFTWYGADSLSGNNTSVRWWDVGTGQISTTGNFTPTNGYYNQTFVTRPWDSRPWTLSDLPYLRMGPLNSQVYQVYITVNWTKIVSVADELIPLVGGGDIWRPLLASDGTIITAGAGGEAVMGFGPP